MSDATFPIFSDKSPSEMFESAFSDSSAGCVRHCACGRVTYNPNGGWDWEEGELERLQENEAANPRKYKSVDYSVPGMMINGEMWVAGCPCNKGGEVEAFLIKHDTSIAEYLRARVKRLRERANEIEVLP